MDGKYITKIGDNTLHFGDMVRIESRLWDTDRCFWYSHTTAKRTVFIGSNEELFTPLSECGIIDGEYISKIEVVSTSPIAEAMEHERVRVQVAEQAFEDSHCSFVPDFTDLFCWKCSKCGFVVRDPSPYLHCPNCGVEVAK